MTTELRELLERGPVCGRDGPAAPAASAAFARPVGKALLGGSHISR